MHIQKLSLTKCTRPRASGKFFFYSSDGKSLLDQLPSQQKPRCPPPYHPCCDFGIKPIIHHVMVLQFNSQPAKTFKMSQVLL